MNRRFEGCFKHMPWALALGYISVHVHITTIVFINSHGGLKDTTKVQFYCRDTNQMYPEKVICTLIQIC